MHSPSLTSFEVKEHLHNILKLTHRVEPHGNPDTLLKTCTPQTCKTCQDKYCYQHEVNSYKKTRRFLFMIDTQEDDEGLFIRSFYCGYDYHSKDFPSIRRGKIPHYELVNTEHLWPQSRFTHLYSREKQKTDLHHLQVTASRVNSTRRNTAFGQVHRLPKKLCNNTFLGGKGDHRVFQPTPSKRGNIARSLFYFSIRYKIHISPQEEEDLRAWHREDPVDEQEWERHQAIIKIQKNRNPFIDYPEIVQRITNF